MTSTVFSSDVLSSPGPPGNEMDPRTQFETPGSSGEAAGARQKLDGMNGKGQGWMVAGNLAEILDARYFI